MQYKTKNEGLDLPAVVVVIFINFNDFIQLFIQIFFESAQCINF